MKKTLIAALVLAALALPTAAANADGLPCDQYDVQCANTLPRTDFYDQHPGPDRPVIAEKFAGYQLDPGVTATRILYPSAGNTGHQAAVSGVVLIPAGPRPAGGWPVILYGHGTSGYATLCAPSLMKDLYHGTQLAQLLRHGYAVVATDYAGLGGPGEHQVADKAVQAQNMLDALHAARAAVPGLSRKWVAYGHSQGGLAVLGVAERASGDRDYLGAVATAPATHLRELVDSTSKGAYTAGFVPLVVAGVQATYPALRPSDVLTPAAASRMPVVGSSCLNTTLGAFADLTGDALVRPGYLDNPYLSAYLRASEPDPARVRGPVLLLQGDADSVVLPQFSADLATSLRSAHVPVDYRSYPGLAHDTLPGGPAGIDDGAMADILTWLDARFHRN